eukprot:sb/3469653/
MIVVMVTCSFVMDSHTSHLLHHHKGQHQHRIVTSFHRSTDTRGPGIGFKAIWVQDYLPVFANGIGTIVTHSAGTTNQNSLYRSGDWLSANQGPVFPDSVIGRFLISNRQTNITYAVALNSAVAFLYHVLSTLLLVVDEPCGGGMEIHLISVSWKYIVFSCHFSQQTHRIAIEQLVITAKPRNQNWKSKLEVETGSRNWKSNLEIKTGNQNWKGGEWNSEGEGYT